MVVEIGWMSDEEVGEPNDWLEAGTRVVSSSRSKLENMAVAGNFSTGTMEKPRKGKDKVRVMERRERRLFWSRGEGGYPRK